MNLRPRPRTLRFYWNGIVSPDGRLHRAVYTLGGLVPGFHKDTVSVYPAGQWQMAGEVWDILGPPPFRLEPGDKYYRAVRAAVEERDRRVRDRLVKVPKFRKVK